MWFVLGLVVGAVVGWYFACLGVRGLVERGELKPTPKFYTGKSK